MTDAPQLSVLLPVFNEEAALREAVETNVRALDQAGVAWEIVIVNDGSADDSGAIARALADDDRRVRLVEHEVNRGLGPAIRTGIAAGRGEYVILSPCDSPFGPGELDVYVEQMGEADIVVGYRAVRPGYSPLMRWNSKLYPVVMRLLFGMRLRDFNWIHMYRRSTVERLEWRDTRIFWQAELLIKARDAGCKIVEVPASVQARETGQATASRLDIMLRTGWDCFTFAVAYYLRRLGRRRSL